MFYVQYRISFTNVAQPSTTELINNLQTASVQEHTGKNEIFRISYQCVVEYNDVGRKVTTRIHTGFFFTASLR
jgi:hypothetical protein